MKINKRINSNINEDSYLYGFSLKNLATEPYFYVLVIKYLLAKRLNEHLISLTLFKEYKDSKRPKLKIVE